MTLKRRVPLAWSLLVHDKKRLFLSVTGVAFAVFLMFIEMGFLNGVYDSQALMLEHLNADIVIVHRFREAVMPSRPILSKELEHVRGFDEVTAAFPVYFQVFGLWKSGGGPANTVAVLGVDLDEPAFEVDGLAACRDALRMPDTALADRRARQFLGDMRPGTVGELNGRKLRVVGDFTLGPDFVVDGRLIMSDRNFASYFRDARSGAPDFEHVEFGLVKTAPGADLDALRDRIQAVMPADTRVYSHGGLIAREQRFFGTQQPIGLIFGLGMVVGFVIGVTICYQILFTDVNDHLAEFATLKAIGFSNAYLVGTVLREAVYLSLVAFLPGLLSALLLYSTLEETTGITMRLTPLRVAAVFLLTITMCLLSATLAVRKVLASDPAEVF